MVNAEILRRPVPVSYQLSQGVSTVFIGVGDRWFPELYLDAESRSGGRLRIESESVIRADPGPILSRGRAYRYFVRHQDLGPRGAVEFRLCTEDGACGNHIRLAYELVTARDLAFEGT